MPAVRPAVLNLSGGHAADTAGAAGLDAFIEVGHLHNFLPPLRSLEAISRLIELRQQLGELLAEVVRERERDQVGVPAGRLMPLHGVRQLAPSHLSDLHGTHRARPDAATGLHLAKPGLAAIQAAKHGYCTFRDDMPAAPAGSMLLVVGPAIVHMQNRLRLAPEAVSTNHGSATLRRAGYIDFACIPRVH